MRALYTDIMAKLGQFVDVNNQPRLKHIAVYNEQTRKAFLPEENKTYSFADPACFVEIQNQNAVQLGNGGKLYPNLTVIFHLAHRQEDAGDGTLDQNLDVLDLKDDLWLWLQKFQPANAHPFGLGEDTEDVNHNNMYIYKQAYKTNYTVLSRIEPLNGVTKSPPTGLEIDVTIQDSTNPQPHIYP